MSQISNFDPSLLNLLNINELKPEQIEVIKQFFESQKVNESLSNMMENIGFYFKNLGDFNAVQYQKALMELEEMKKKAMLNELSSKTSRIVDFFKSITKLIFFSIILAGAIYVAYFFIKKYGIDKIMIKLGEWLKKKSDERNTQNLLSSLKWLEELPSKDGERTEQTKQEKIEIDLLNGSSFVKKLKFSLIARSNEKTETEFNIPGCQKANDLFQTINGKNSFLDGLKDRSEFIYSTGPVGTGKSHMGKIASSYFPKYLSIEIKLEEFIPTNQSPQETTEGFRTNLHAFRDMIIELQKNNKGNIPLIINLPEFDKSLNNTDLKKINPSNLQDILSTNFIDNFTGDNSDGTKEIKNTLILMDANLKFEETLYFKEESGELIKKQTTFNRIFGAINFAQNIITNGINSYTANILGNTEKANETLNQKAENDKKTIENLLEMLKSRSREKMYDFKNFTAKQAFEALRFNKRNELNDVFNDLFDNIKIEKEAGDSSKQKYNLNALDNEKIKTIFNSLFQKITNNDNEKVKIQANFKNTINSLKKTKAEVTKDELIEILMFVFLFDKIQEELKSEDNKKKINELKEEKYTQLEFSEIINNYNENVKTENNSINENKKKIDIYNQNNFYNLNELINFFENQHNNIENLYNIIIYNIKNNNSNNNLFQDLNNKLEYEQQFDKNTSQIRTLESEKNNQCIELVELKNQLEQIKKELEKNEQCENIANLAITLLGQIQGQDNMVKRLIQTTANTIYNGNSFSRNQNKQKALTLKLVEQIQDLESKIQDLESKIQNLKNQNTKLQEKIKILNSINQSLNDYDEKSYKEQKNKKLEELNSLNTNIQKNIQNSKERITKELKEKADKFLDELPFENSKSEILGYFKNDNTIQENQLNHTSGFKEKLFAKATNFNPLKILISDLEFLDFRKIQSFEKDSLFASVFFDPKKAPKIITNQKPKRIILWSIIFGISLTSLMIFNTVLWTRYKVKILESIGSATAWFIKFLNVEFLINHSPEIQVAAVVFSILLFAFIEFKILKATFPEIDVQKKAKSGFNVIKDFCTKTVPSYFENKNSFAWRMSFVLIASSFIALDVLALTALRNTILEKTQFACQKFLELFNKPSLLDHLNKFKIGLTCFLALLVLTAEFFICKKVSTNVELNEKFFENPFRSNTPPVPSS